MRGIVSNIEIVEHGLRRLPCDHAALTIAVHKHAQRQMQASANVILQGRCAQHRIAKDQQLRIHKVHINGRGPRAVIDPREHGRACVFHGSHQAIHRHGHAICAAALRVVFCKYRAGCHDQSSCECHHPRHRVPHILCWSRAKCPHDRSVPPITLSCAPVSV